MPDHRSPSPRIASRTRRFDQGFSLIELVLVVVIIGIVAAIAVPRYADALARYRADAAAMRVVADLTRAQNHAKATSTNTTVEFLTAENEIRISELADLDGGRGMYTTSLDDEPYFANLTTAIADDDSTLIFNGYGKPDSAALLILINGGLERMITVDATTGEIVCH